MQRHSNTQRQKLFHFTFSLHFFGRNAFVYILDSVFPSDAVAFFFSLRRHRRGDFFLLFSLSRVVYCFGHTFTSDCYQHFIDSLVERWQKKGNLKFETSFVVRDDCECVLDVGCRRILGDDIYYEKTSYGVV